MKDDLFIDATTHGFLLGIQVAERLNGLAAGRTLQHEAELADLVWAVAEGSNSLAAENAQVLRAFSGSADQTDTAKIREAMKTSAACLVEWYRRQYIS